MTTTPCTLQIVRFEVHRMYSAQVMASQIQDFPNTKSEVLEAPPVEKFLDLQCWISGGNSGYNSDSDLFQIWDEGYLHGDQWVQRVVVIHVATETWKFILLRSSYVQQLTWVASVCCR